MQSLADRYHFYRTEHHDLGHDGKPYSWRIAARYAIASARTEIEAERYGIRATWVFDDEGPWAWFDGEPFNCECENPRCKWRPRERHEHKERERQADRLAEREESYGRLVYRCDPDCPVDDWWASDAKHTPRCEELDACWGFVLTNEGTYRQIEDARRMEAVDGLEVGVEAYRGTLAEAATLNPMIPAAV